jgi:hypothetical protein
MPLLERSSALPRGAETFSEPRRMHHVVTIRRRPDDVAELIGVARLPIGGERHDLIFIRGMQKSEIGRHLLVQDSQ